MIFIISYLLCWALASRIFYLSQEAEDYHYMTKREIIGFSVFIGAAGPVSLFVVYLTSGFAQHGIWKRK